MVSKRITILLWFTETILDILGILPSFPFIIYPYSFILRTFSPFIFIPPHLSLSFSSIHQCLRLQPAWKPWCQALAPPWFRGRRPYAREAASHATLCTGRRQGVAACPTPAASALMSLTWPCMTFLIPHTRWGYCLFSIIFTLEGILRA